MIACYVWTDIQLLNMLNAKRSVYAGEQAALFVLMLKRVTPALVDAIEVRDDFAQVIRIPPPDAFEGLPRWCRRMRLLFHAGAFRRYFRSFVPAVKYERLLTSGYWSYTMFLLQAMYDRNPDISVKLVEEGIGSYYRSRARSCQIWPKTCMAERVTKWVYFGRFAKKAASILNGIIVYHPELVNVHVTEKAAMPPLAENMAVFRPLLEVWSREETPLTYGEDNTFLFPMMGLVPHDEDMERRIWDKLLEFDSKALRLEHPDVKDCSEMPFETICAQRDISSCILVGFSSGCMVYPKYCFLQEPYVIFLHRLYGQDSGLCIREAQVYMENLRVCYQNPEKISAPRSLEEMDYILAKIKTRWRESP